MNVKIITKEITVRKSEEKEQKASKHKLYYGTIFLKI